MATTDPYVNSVNVQVCLVVNLPGGTKSVSAPQPGLMYDETKPGADYKRCIKLPGLEDQQLPKNGDLWQLRDWVRAATKVVVYPADSSALEDLDTKGVKVGLTSLQPDTETKGINSLKAVPIALFTPEAIKEIGL